MCGLAIYVLALVLGAPPGAVPEAAETPCSGAVYELPGPFVGSWREYTVTEEGEELAGELRSEFDAGGCVYSQRFRSADGAFSFLSFGYVRQPENQWYETFVLSDGRVASYLWREEGEAVIVERVGGSPDDRRRLRIINVTADSYDVVEERSRDGGESWTQVELTRTRRVE